VPGVIVYLGSYSCSGMVTKTLIGASASGTLTALLSTRGLAPIFTLVEESYLTPYALTV
jgi:hypothetical protein